MNAIIRFFKTLDLSGFADEVFSSKRLLYRFIALAVLVRLFFLIPPGYTGDLNSFENWADKTSRKGLSSAYENQATLYECDYPPLYLYVLKATGHLFHFFGWFIYSGWADRFLKLINLLAEAVFLFWLWRTTRNRLLFLVFLFNPITIVNAYAWGQIDVMFGALIFCSFYYLIESKIYYSSVFLALSLALKSQAILFLPIAALFLVKSDTTWIKKVKSFLVFLLVFLALHIPFFIWSPNPVSPLEVQAGAAGRYPFISLNALNIWWGIFVGQHDAHYFSLSNVPVMGLVTREIIAFFCFGMIAMLIFLGVVKKEQSKEQKYSLIALYCFSYFMFLPEMHERYLFPFFFFAAPVAVTSKAELRFLLVIAAVHLFNLAWSWVFQYHFIEISFYSAKVVAFALFIIWLFYVRHVLRLQKTGV